MAGKMDCLQESLSCPVCFEEFRENGDHVPRLLPCSHSLCQRCTGQLIPDNRLECPTCRVKHEARQEEMSFPQNILTLMKKKHIEEGEKGEYTMCTEHEKDEVLFCQEPGCKIAICILCLSASHLGPKVVAMEEEIKDTRSKILNMIEVTSQSLNAKITDVTNASQRAKEKTASSLVELKRKKNEIIEHFDKMIQKTIQHEKNLIKTSQDELNIFKENLNHLDEIRRNCEGQGITHTDLSRRLEEVESIKLKEDELWPKVRNYEYPKYLVGHRNSIGELMMWACPIPNVREMKGESE